MVQKEKKIRSEGRRKKNSFQGVSEKKIKFGVNLTLKIFFLRFSCQTMLLKNKNFVRRVGEKKNWVRENPHHAPPRWLMVDPLYCWSRQSSSDSGFVSIALYLIFVNLNALFLISCVFLSSFQLFTNLFIMFTESSILFWVFTVGWSILPPFTRAWLNFFNRVYYEMQNVSSKRKVLLYSISNLC